MIFYSPFLQETTSTEKLISLKMKMKLKMLFIIQKYLRIFEPVRHQGNINIKINYYQSLFDLLSNRYGETRALQFFIDYNEKAPLTIRANPIKITRDKLIERFKERFGRDFFYKKTDYSPFGVIFRGTKQINLTNTSEYREGLFEVQDEASQLCSLRVGCRAGDKVLDYCSGSGGKTLAFAHQMENKGQIILHDSRMRPLEKARERLKRAGVTNYSIAYKGIKLKFDWILADMPCSGLGTIRRNPDIKIYFNEEHLNELKQKQREIFDRSYKYLKEDGKMVYVTCSFLKEENEDQIKYFCEKYNMEVYKQSFFQSLPMSGGMDSFFSSTLVNKKK